MEEVDMKQAQDGGCWYCSQDEENAPLLFDETFDVYYHAHCEFDEVQKNFAHDV
jgi:hypothetical protein